MIWRFSFTHIGHGRHGQSLTTLDIPTDHPPRGGGGGRKLRMLAIMECLIEIHEMRRLINLPKRNTRVPIMY